MAHLFEKSFDLSVRGIHTSCHVAGSGVPLLLLHGSGPGTSAAGTWRFILDRLTDDFLIYAPDLIGFGESGENPVSPSFDADLWLEQALAIIDEMPPGPIAVYGHSISGYTALRIPSKCDRVAAVMTTGTMGWQYTRNFFTDLTWTLPRSRQGLRTVLESLVHDKSQITEDFVEQRYRLLSESDKAMSFDAMFAGDKQFYIDSCVLSPAELNSVACPVLLIHGRSDQIIRPEDTTMALAARLLQADVALLGSCGHLPATERPETISALAKDFFCTALQSVAAQPKTNEE